MRTASVLVDQRFGGVGEAMGGSRGWRWHLALLGLCFLGSPLQAEVVLEPPGATVEGKTIAEWSADWWRWGVALAPPGSPFTDTTGAYAGVGQSGPVFFLAGSPGGTRSRFFAVPADKYVLVPLVAGEWSQLELGFDKTASEIRLAAQDQANLIDSLHATLDGVAIPQAQLFTHRVASPDFNFTAVAGNSLNVPAGNSGIAVADGYFLMLAPLSLGYHTLRYGGTASALGVGLDETDTIVVGAVTITKELTNQTVTAGETVTFAVEADGGAPLGFQWYYNEILIPTNGLPIARPITNATTAALTFKATESSAGYYWVVVSNVVGRVASFGAALTVLPGARFTSIVVNDGSVRLEWDASPGFAVEQTTSLAAPDWQMVAGSANTNRITIPAVSGGGFFRLVKP